MTARDEIRELQDAALNALEAGAQPRELLDSVRAVIRDYHREVLAATVGTDL